MKRIKSFNKSGITYNKQEEPIVLSKSLFDVFLKQDSPSELIALYSFYYYTAKWQNTNQPKATIDYIARGLKWSSEKVRKYRKLLLNLNLIEDIKQKGTFGHFSGYYVKINFISNINHPHGSPEAGINHRMDTKEGNALNPNNKNNITPTQFDKFWKLYPKKVNKGKALTSWLTICSRHNYVPTFKQVVKAIQEQKESEQWQDLEFIPNPTTWLNQRRWLDDASLMKSYKRNSYQDKNMPTKKLEYGEWWYLKKDGKYYNDSNQILM